MTSDIDSIDWSQYPPDRVEGLKYFYKGSSSVEDRPCTEEELKMLCIKWDCRVDMKVDNFLYWLMKKTKEKNYNGNHELFVRDMPEMAAALRRRGLHKYEKYQEEYGEKNRQYLEHCAEWRKIELRRLRFLDKLRALCSTWSWSDSEDEESDSEDESNVGLPARNEAISSNAKHESNVELAIKIEEVTFSSFDSDESVNTVVDTVTRYNSYPETQSDVIVADVGHIGAEVEIENVLADDLGLDLGDVNSQLFVPGTTSTQNK